MQNFFNSFDLNKNKEVQQLLEAATLPRENPLETCIAWYDVAICCLKTEFSHDWFNMEYEKALGYINNAFAKDLFLGNLLKIFVGMTILEKMKWYIDNQETQEIYNKISDAVFPELILGLHISHKICQLPEFESEIPKYKHILKNVFLFDNKIDFGSEQFKLEMETAIGEYQEDGLSCHSLSRNEILNIKSRAEEFVKSLTINEPLTKKPQVN